MQTKNLSLYLLETSRPAFEETMEQADDSTPSLHMRLFGPFDVHVAGQPLRPLRTRKGNWLLALLVLRHDRSVERSWLAGTLWPESDESQALKNLRESLTDLRNALGEAGGHLIAPTPRTLRLDLTAAFADVVAFDRAIQQNGVASLEEAVELYRGPLLEGCTEEWVGLEREARAQGYLSAMETLAGRARKRGDPATAVRYLRLAVMADPFGESAHAALMEALAECGDYAEVTLLYREFRLRLRQELHTEPTAETTALWRRLRQEARTLSDSDKQPPPSNVVSHPSQPSRLPHPWTQFVGRKQEISELLSSLERARLVTLTGTGGIGKTRLAIQVAKELEEEYTNGVCFVELAPLEDPDLVPGAVALALGVIEESGRPLLESLQTFLRDRQLLLVLDNCEHLVEACARLAASLLGWCPDLRLLATSRQAFGLAGEKIWRVPSLSLPDPGLQNGEGEGGPSLLESEAVQLFVERATQHSPRFELTTRNSEAIVQVCVRLDGIPLALELAAARMKVLSVEQIAARLDDCFRLLTGGSRDALPASRHYAPRLIGLIISSQRKSEVCWRACRSLPEAARSRR